MTESKIKAVGLISGGLDSLLATKLIIRLGIDVLGVCFESPFFKYHGTFVKKISHFALIYLYTCQPVVNSQAHVAKTQVFENPFAFLDSLEKIGSKRCVVCYPRIN